MGRKTTTTKDIFRSSGRNPSLRQVRAVEVYLDGNGRVSKAEALREAGYSASVIDHPDKVFNSRAVIQMAAKMGITEKLGLEAVQRNLTHKDGRVQLAAADTLFKLLGSYAPKQVVGNHDHRVGVFSMRDLREKMRDNGIEVTDPIIQ